MFNTRTVLSATAVGALVAGLLIGLMGAPQGVAAFTGVAVGAIAAITPWTVRDGRFPGPRSGAEVRRVLGIGYVVVMGSALVGLAGLNVDRTTRFSLQFLVLAVGAASLMLGSVAAMLDSEQSTDSSVQKRGGI